MLKITQIPKNVFICLTKAKNPTQRPPILYEKGPRIFPQPIRLNPLRAKNLKTAALDCSTPFHTARRARSRACSYLALPSGFSSSLVRLFLGQIAGIPHDLRGNVVLLRAKSRAPPISYKIAHLAGLPGYRYR